MDPIPEKTENERLRKQREPFLDKFLEQFKDTRDSHQFCRQLGSPLKSLAFGLDLSSL
jgi:hypothetical protein